MRSDFSLNNNNKSDRIEVGTQNTRDEANQNTREKGNQNLRDEAANWFESHHRTQIKGSCVVVSR